ncbi:MAG: DNA repair protein RadA [Pseudomonadota bacterium]
MVKSAVQYVCQNCGAVSAKWAGRCDQCGEWNTLTEEVAEAGPPGSLSAGPKGGASARPAPVAFTDLASDEANVPRLVTGSAEFDRVVGGGLVPGSATLLGGDPGVGKSTLLLQIAAALSMKGHEVAYISGEEATAQIRLRAHRLGLSDKPVKLASATALRDIIASLKAEKPDVVIIDSIQTVWSDAVPGTPGSVTQMRTCSQDLIRYAKQSGAVMILVGHVTKDGQIAGPRVVEHMVDAVMYFEAETGRDFRLLRAVKNRFGAAQEIGVFEMTGAGLRQVANPSALFLAGRGQEGSGSAIFAGIEGTRPLLVEFQALVSPSTLAAPRRAVVGWDSARLSMLLAVLDTRCGLSFGRHDVFLNVAGGMRISEPAADLAAAAALTSSLFDADLPADQVIFGEVALSGQIRPVSQADARLQEAAKLGFSSALTPRSPAKAPTKKISGAPSGPVSNPNTKLTLHDLGSLGDLVRTVKGTG